MAHYYHYYFIFPPLQRGPETTEKQKAREININKSSGQRTAGAPAGDTRRWKERTGGGEEERERARSGMKGVAGEKEDTYRKRGTKRRERKRVEGRKGGR